jgi:hypothetical protein
MRFIHLFGTAHLVFSLQRLLLAQLLQPEALDLRPLHVLFAAKLGVRRLALRRHQLLQLIHF